MAAQNDRSMAGKTCVVTGATSGIGRVTAEALARRGARVVMLARDARRGAEAVEQIKRAAGNPDVELVVADLSSLAEVRRAAGEVRARCPRIDVLVNNAGAVNSTRQTTVDGVELTFALNHMAYFVLTTELLDVLEKSAPARVINVSSEAHRGARIDFDDIQLARRYSGFRAYGQSKLANILFTYELARRLAGRGVTVNALHPGVVRTGFALNNKGVFAFLVRLFGIFLLSPEKGAATTIYLATSPDVAGVTGQYFIRNKPRKSSAASYDPTAAQRLWELSEQMAASVGQA